MNITTIRVNKEVKDKLREFESHPRETNEDIIKKLTGKSNNQCFVCDTEFIFNNFPELKSIKFSKEYTKKLCSLHKNYFSMSRSENTISKIDKNKLEVSKK